MHTDRLQILFTLKAPLAIAAPMLPPVTFVVHMSFGFSKRVKGGVAAFTIELWTPMAVSVHVIGSCILRPELCVARFTLPMAYCIHVLLCCMPVTERPTTHLAVDHFDNDVSVLEN